jgi:hypothetical protein
LPGIKLNRFIDVKYTIVSRSLPDYTEKFYGKYRHPQLGFQRTHMLSKAVPKPTRTEGSPNAVHVLEQAIIIIFLSSAFFIHFAQLRMLFRLPRPFGRAAFRQMRTRALRLRRHHSAYINNEPPREGRGGLRASRHRRGSATSCSDARKIMHTALGLKICKNP